MRGPAHVKKSKIVSVDGSVQSVSGGEVSKAKSKSFGAMGLSSAVMKGVVRCGFTKPTPIQRKAIPLALQGHDLVAMARTGSGKTAAFVLPILERLKAHSEIVGARALILSPTRDLAMQTIKFLRMVGKDTGLRSILVVGGESMFGQFTDLSLNPDIIVATPGRLLHHIVEAGISFSRLEVLVFDEADRMFEMGFADQINAIAKTLRPERQTMLFSATLPAMVYEFARAGLHDPKLIRLDKHVTLPPNLQLAFFLTATEQKIAAFIYLFKFIIEPHKQSLVFCATRHTAQMLQLVLSKMLGIDAGVVFGSMEAEMRKLNIERFRDSQMRVMLVTDVAARGIDIPALDVVVNYDMPPTPKIFVHRVGRVGRGDAQNDPKARFVAYSIVGTLDVAHMCDVHLFLSKPLANAAPNVDELHTSCCYGSVPAVMLDAELNAFRRACDRDIDLKERHRVALGANQNYFKTRAMASKEGATLSKTIEHVTIHPLILALGDAAGGDAREEERLALVRSYLGGYRPKQTVFELETASAASRSIMEAKRAVHPERRSRKRAERDPIVEHAAEGSDEGDEEEGDEEEDQERNPHDDESDHEDDSFSGDEKPGAEDSSNEDARPDVEYLDDAKAAPSVKPGTFTGAFKDPAFFMSMRPGDASSRTQIAGLRVRGDSMGERDVIMDLMPDEDVAFKKNGLVWDRRKKKYVGANEADKRSSSVQSTTSTRRLVNEAGKQLTKEDEKLRGKVYKEWMAKTKRSLPVVGEVEARETSESFKDRSAVRSKWARAEETKKLKSSGTDRELRTTDQLKKELKAKERNKLKNMPKAQRRNLVAKRRAAQGGGRDANAPARPPPAKKARKKGPSVQGRVGKGGAPRRR